MNWRPYPFIRLLVPLMAGISLSLWLNIPIPNFPIVCLALLAVLIAFFYWNLDFRYRAAFGVLCSLTLLVIGYGLTYTQNELRQPTHFSHLPSEDEGMIVQLKDMPVVGKWVKVPVEVQHLHTPSDSFQNASGNILLYLERDSASEALSYGDVLALRNTKPMVVEEPKNPHAFDYSRYLHFKNIHYQAFIRGNNWHRLATNKGNPILHLSFSLREQFLTVLKKHLVKEESYAVGSAMIIGYREEISDEMQRAYMETGAVHVLAVSGMHVGLVYVFLSFLLGLVKWQNRRWKFLQLLLQLLGIWTFALVTGAAPSICRAAAMFSFFIVGKFWQRNRNVYNTMAASAFFLLLYNPYWLLDVGFQLSYLAVLGIVYFQPRIYKLWTIENWLGDAAWKLIAVSLAAQLTTFPITLFYFHQFPNYFWLSGLVAVPAASLILGGGLLLFLLDSLSFIPTYWLGRALDEIIYWTNASIYGVQKLPGGLIQGVWLQPSITLLLYAILIAGVVAVSRKNATWLLGALGLSVLVAGNYAFTEVQQLKNRTLTVYHINGHTIVDLFDGEQVISLQSDSIPPSDFQFATQNHRWALRIKTIQTVNLDSIQHFQADNVLYEQGFVQFYDKRMAIYPPSSFNESLPQETIAVDYLLLRQNASVDIATLQERYQFSTLIFDASNNWKTIKHWQEECEAAGIAFYDVREQGAFVEVN